MCGIYGIVSASLPEDEIYSRLRQMGGRQRHRGPDDQGEMTRSGDWGALGMGLVRLAILDLFTGMQPIVSVSDDTAMVCNGQVYNYIELRQQVAGAHFTSRGDIEVALHLYRKKGIDFLNELNGMYAGAIYDPVGERLVLFRDRFGIKPLYYTNASDGFAFASEIKPLFSAVSRRRQLNQNRVATYFTYRYVPGGDTLFEGIHRLPPGAFLLYHLKTRSFEIHRYWDYHLDRVRPDMSLNEAAERFGGLFSDAVKIRLRSDVELGSFISGGIDSSAVSAEVAGLHPSLQLFSIAFNEAKYDEMARVKQLLSAQPARFANTRLESALCSPTVLNRLPAIIRAIEEPISLGTIVPTDQVCELAGQKVKAVMTGEGADEIFAGYRKFMIEMAAQEFEKFPADQRKQLVSRFPELKGYMDRRHADAAQRYIQPEILFEPDMLSRLIGTSAPTAAFSQDARPVLTGREHPVNANIAYEARFRLPDYVVLRLDKLSMRHSLETRTPLLDYRLAEFAAELPLSLKVNLAMDREKFICAYAYVRRGLLNAAIAFRKKQPFTFPMADWLADSSALPDFIKDILFGDIVRRQNVLDPKVVRSIAESVTGAGVGPQTLVSEADRLFSIIVFTIWYQEMMTAEL